MEAIQITPHLGLDSTKHEAYNTIATNLIFARPNGGVIAVSSPRSKTGRSIATLGLAVALVNAGRSVLVIDGDLRTGALSALSGVSEVAGLSSVLFSKATAEACILETDQPKLSILAAGELLPDPTSVLSSDALVGLLSSLKEQNADFILIDTPAVLPTADGSLIAAAADCSILYVPKNSVSRRELRAARAQLEKCGHPAIGVIVGNAPAKSRLSFLSRFSFFGKKAKSNAR